MTKLKILNWFINEFRHRNYLLTKMCKFSFANYQKCTYINNTKILYKVKSMTYFCWVKNLYLHSSHEFHVKIPLSLLCTLSQLSNIYLFSRNSQIINGLPPDFLAVGIILNSSSDWENLEG